METATAMSTALGQITDVVSTCFSIITGNQILMVCFVACIVGIGFGVISRAKAAAKN